MNIENHEDKKKIFIICNYVTDDDVHQFSRNRTGYGYIVGDIISGLSSVAKVSAFTYSGNYSGFTYSNAKIISNRFSDILIKLKLFNLWDAALFFLKNILSQKEALRVAYSYLACGYLKNKIQNFDSVQIHGCTPNLIPFIKLSIESGKKTLVTLHGLNSFSEDTKATPLIRKAERVLLKLLISCPNLTISVLTPMAKEIIEKHLGQGRQRIVVIPNLIKHGIGIDHLSRKDKELKLVLYIGNLSIQKNQKALLDVIRNRWQQYRGKVKFLFIGDVCDDFDSEIKFFSDKKDLVEFTGHIPRLKLSQLYNRADLIVLLSKVEGFGMSIIEGFSAGLPVLINRQMEIYSLIGSKKFVYSVVDVGDVLEVEDKLLEALGYNFGVEAIHQYAKTFNVDSITNKYLTLLS